ncbi:MAG: 50S ribosomal protein L29 [Patescibacteria group bacterium]
MELKELRQKPVVELQKLIRTWREQQRDLRFKVLAKQHKDVRDLRQIKKDIARLLTVIREKEIVDKLRRVSTNKQKA